MCVKKTDNQRVTKVLVQFKCVRSVIYREYLHTIRKGIECQQLFTITSRAFLDDDFLDLKFTCDSDGDALTPPLYIKNQPSQTKSLALTLIDPDIGQEGFTHWILFNLPKNLVELEQGRIPADTQVGLNSKYEMCYLPPCPESGEHRYIFTIYALDIVLSLGNKDKIRFKQEIKNHVLASGQIQVRYVRK